MTRSMYGTNLNDGIFEEHKTMGNGGNVNNGGVCRKERETAII